MLTLTSSLVKTSRRNSSVTERGSRADSGASLADRHKARESGVGHRSGSRGVEDQGKSFVNLRHLQELLHDPERFRRPGFRLLWAREAYRSGNVDGAMTEWRLLAA